MTKVIQAQLIAKGKKFALIASRFNEFITQKLLEGALDELIKHGASERDLTVVWVPGAFEMPGLANRLARAKKYNAIICLGAVIRGQTPHFDYIASEVAKGIANVSLNSSTPAMFGVITADNLEQAIERAGTKLGNRGRNAALSAIEMANLIEQV
jgi:6,7-dimethyl-8-ribityllumazine synthase